MLKYITLKDFAVVSEAEISFDDGMTVISGETGAGKSLLVDALLWLTGTRADAGVVRHGAERAELHAEFDLSDAAEARAWLAQQELDEDSACQLRRIIRADGGSRAWINARPATVSQLSELGALLVSIHGQHEHQALLGRFHQMQLVDGFADNQAKLADIAQIYQSWRQCEKRLAALQKQGDVSDRIEYLKFQLKELNEHLIEPDQLTELLSAHRRQANATSLLQACDTLVEQLQGERSPGIADRLSQMHATSLKASKDEPRFADIAELISSAQIQLDEVAKIADLIRDSLDLDPEAYAQMESRLTRLHDIARKHRVPLDELNDLQARLDSELGSLENSGAEVDALQTELKRLHSGWAQAAQQLSQSRSVAAKKMAAKVSALMSELGMAGGQLKIELEPNADDQPSLNGAERAEFLVSANPGQPPRPLRKVASGGELARISLAIEVATLGLEGVPTLVFDEVDAGIGGAVAEIVGGKLRDLSTNRQVMCVTHLPQVASQAHQHFRVTKAVQKNQTFSTIVLMDPAQRVEEISRMLGGVEINDATRKAAKAMLKSAQPQKAAEA